MLDTAKLSGLAEAEIDGLQAEGITLTPAEIVKINALAWNVETPESRRLLSRGVPVFVGGVTLWPFTIAGYEWFDRVGSVMKPRWLRTAAMAYSMAHGRDDDAAMNCDGRDAARMVRKWHKHLRCTWGELNVAMSQIISQDEGAGDELPPDIGTGKGMGSGEFSVLLAATAGGTADFWERRCSRNYAYSVLSTIARQKAADGEGLACDEVLAEKALGWAIERIRRRAVGNGEA